MGGVVSMVLGGLVHSARGWEGESEGERGGEGGEGVGGVVGDERRRGREGESGGGGGGTVRGSLMMV